MVLVWRDYQTDLGRNYPFYSIKARQLNDVPSDFNPLELLPSLIRNQQFEITSSCVVSGLTPRQLILWTGDGAQFCLVYPQPFSELLADYLTNNLDVAAFEFVGERVKDGRLRRMLPNV